MKIKAIADANSPIAPKWCHPTPGIDFDVYDKKSGRHLFTAAYPEMIGSTVGKIVKAKLGNPKDAAAVKDALAAAINGASKRQITLGLKRAKCFTREGTPYRDENLVALLSKKLYVLVGLFTDNEQDAALQMLALRKQEHEPRIKDRWLLNGLLECGHCRKPITGSVNHTQDHYYTCPNGADADPECQHPYGTQTDLEECIEKALRARNLLPKTNGDRATRIANLKRIVDRILFSVEHREKIGTVKLLRRKLVILFKQQKGKPKHKPVTIDEWDISPAVKWRVFKAVKAAVRDLEISEIAAELPDLKYGTVYAGAERAVREGMLKKRPQPNKHGAPAKYGLPPARPKRTLTSADKKRSAERRVPTAAAHKTRSQASSNADATEPARPFPKLQVDESNRLIRGANGEKIDLFKSPLSWHIFYVHYRAGRRAIDEGELKNGYGDHGEWSARYTAMSRLNDELRKVGHEIARRALRECELPTGR